MSLEKVNSALVAAFRAGAFFADSEIAFENIKFETPTNKPFARLEFHESTCVVTTLGSTGYNTSQGWLKVCLYYPKDTGREAVGTMADAISTYFKTGNKLTNSGQVTVIRRCQRGNSFSGRFYEVPVFVHYYAQINR